MHMFLYYAIKQSTLSTTVITNDYFKRPDYIQTIKMSRSISVSNLTAVLRKLLKFMWSNKWQQKNI